MILTAIAFIFLRYKDLTITILLAQDRGNIKTVIPLSMKYVLDTKCQNYAIQVLFMTDGNDFLIAAINPNSVNVLDSQ